MSAAAALADLLGLPPRQVEAAVALVRAAVREEVWEAAVEAQAQAASAEETIYTIDDVLQRVPWGRSTVDKMVARRQIPMVKVEGRWIITAAAFRDAAARGFAVPAGRVGGRSRWRSASSRGRPVRSE